MENTRNTLQRELVLQAVKALGNHPSAEEIYQNIFMQYPTISRGTVYRNLKVLVQMGKLLQIKVSGGADRYDHQTKEHYHLQCISCGEIIDILLNPVPDVSKLIIDNQGYTIVGSQVLIEGVCPKCQREI